MEYDLEIIILACKKYQSRFRDFKKYGLLNIKDKKIKVNIILSNSEEISDIKENWPTGVSVHVQTEFNKNSYVQNIHNFFLNFNLEKINSRWIVKLDDDSITDVSGLVDNLDRFYNYEEPFYLAASCNRFENSGGFGKEYWCLPQHLDYLNKLKDYKNLIFLLNHEVECCIISSAGLKRILTNRDSLDLIRERTKVPCGCTDITLAFAAAMAKLYPIDCPFLTHLPELQKFSFVTGGIKNHIHLISREIEGENFDNSQRGSKYSFFILSKIVEKKYSKLEKIIEYKKCKMDLTGDVVTYKFLPNHILKPMIRSNFYSEFPTDTETDFDLLFWFEKDGEIYILDPKKSTLTYEDQILKKIDPIKILNQKIF